MRNSAGILRVRAPRARRSALGVMRKGPCLSRIGMRADGVDRSRYPFSVPAIASLTSLVVRSPVLFFVGENGSGKSTLLEALAVACGFGAEGGSRNLRFTTRAGTTHDRSDPDAPIEELADALTLRWTRRQRDGFFLRAESFYDFATMLDRSQAESEYGPGFLRPYGGRSLHAQSHGESFLTLFLERFSKRGIYLLDEPEAALSPARQLALLVRMHDLIASDEQTQFDRDAFADRARLSASADRLVRRRDDRRDPLPADRCVHDHTPRTQRSRRHARSPSRRRRNVLEGRYSKRLTTRVTNHW